MAGQVAPDSSPAVPLGQPPRPPPPRVRRHLPRGNGPINSGVRPAFSGSARLRHNRNTKTPPRSNHSTRARHPRPARRHRRAHAAARAHQARASRVGRRPARTHAGSAGRARILRPRGRRGRRPGPARQWGDDRPPIWERPARPGAPGPDQRDQPETGERHPPARPQGARLLAARSRPAQPPHGDDRGAGHRAGGRGHPGPRAADRSWAEVRPAHREPAPDPERRRARSCRWPRLPSRPIPDNSSAGSSRPSTGRRRQATRS